MEQRFQQINRMHLDQNNRAFLTLQFANAWLGIRLDWIGAFAISSIALVIGMHSFLFDE